MENMTSIDFGIIGFILFLGFKGLFNGFFKELFGLIGVIGGVFIGTRLGQEAGVYINDNFLHLDNSSVIVITGFLASFIAFWIGMTILGKIFSAFTDKIGLGAFDKLLGFAFAGAKVAMIFAVIIHSLLAVKVIQDSSKEYTENSIVIPYLQEMGSYIINADFSAMVSQAEEKTGLDLDETIQKVKDAMPTSEEVQNGVNKVVETTVNQQLSE